MEMGDIFLLASEQDTFMCNTIEISVHLFVNLYDTYDLFFCPGY